MLGRRSPPRLDSYKKEPMAMPRSSRGYRPNFSWSEADRLVRDQLDELIGKQLHETSGPTRGGGEQVRAIRRTSARPSRLGLREGWSCFLRSRAASNPCSTKRRRTRSTVAMLTSRASAIHPSGQ